MSPCAPAMYKDIAEKPQTFWQPASGSIYQVMAFCQDNHGIVRSPQIIQCFLDLGYKFFIVRRPPNLTFPGKYRLLRLSYKSRHNRTF